MKHKPFIYARCIRQCVVAVASFFAVHANAQTYINPTAFEDSYAPVGSPNINNTTHTSCYSFSNVNLGAGNVDLVTSGWDVPGGPSTVAWRELAPGIPSTIVNQGMLNYGGAQDLEVGIVNAGGIQLLVAYYRPGFGHVLDVYNWLPGGPVFAYNVILSGIPFYTRISMDCHKLYGVALTWEDPFAGIQTMLGATTGGPLTFSGVLTLAGTMGETQPDCAFSHTTSNLNVHFAYYNPATQAVTEAEYQFWPYVPLPSMTVTYATNDVNFVGPVNMPPVNLDCPDHYGVDNWAYTYTPNSNDIVVRLIDFNTSGVPTTVIVNNGSLGNTPNNAAINVNSFVAYDYNCIMGIGSMYVGWYSTDIDPMTGNANGYTALQMDESGSFLLTPNDYLTVANNPTFASPTPYLSFSKQNDQTNYLYTVFPESQFGNYSMQNKYHPWSTAAFKGHHEKYTCNDEANLAAFAQKQQSAIQLTAYPNPFTDKLILKIPAELQSKTADITITDITGKSYGTYSGPLQNANERISNMSSTLAAGSYFMNVSVQGEQKQTIRLVKADK